MCVVINFSGLKYLCKILCIMNVPNLGDTVMHEYLLLYCN